MKRFTTLIDRLHYFHVWEIALALTIVFVVISIFYSNYITLRLAEEETKLMEIWAEATRQFIQADENTDIDFVSYIIEDNTNIPVYMLDAEGNILLTRNVTDTVADPTQLHGPIVVEIDENTTQYIFYDDSIALRHLHLYPYISFSILVLFIVIALVVIYTTQRSEQNRVWVGLTKETAHQLGTPISSLAAWQQLLQQRYPDDEYIPQVQLDINRLQAITERFSKIGSEPELTLQPVLPVINQTVTYMQARISKKVALSAQCDDNCLDAQTLLNAPLFQWVLENLIKNAVDAISGPGSISLKLHCENRTLLIDVTDTGKGIKRNHFKRIFRPGFTTKQRGWGLGLSLSKRIIEDYHRGKLFVYQSVQGQGTTFRIQLKNAINNAPAA